MENCKQEPLEMNRWLGNDPYRYDDDATLLSDLWVCVAASAATLLLAFWMSID